MAKVVISGYYGFANTGDEAILAAIIQALRQQEKGVEIVVLSANPAQTAKDYQVAAISRNNLQGIIKELKKAQLFISGGGGLLQDVTSPRTIPYYLTLVYIAKLLGVPTAFYAQGIGPIQGGLGKFLVSWVGKKVDLITLRDEKSRQELLQLGFSPAKIQVTADPVLGLQPEGQGELILQKEGIVKDGRPLLGISLRPWQNLKEHQEAVVQTAQKAMAEWQAQIVFLPFHLPGDYQTCLEVAAQVGPEAKVLSGDYLPAQYLSLLGEMDLVLGMRLHALIFAARMGVPLVGLSYDPKIDRFLQVAGHQPGIAVEKLNFAALWPLVDKTWQEREEIKKKLKAAVAPLEEQALANARLVWQLVKGRCRE